MIVEETFVLVEKVGLVFFAVALAAENVVWIATVEGDLVEVVFVAVSIVSVVLV